MAQIVHHHYNNSPPQKLNVLQQQNATRVRKQPQVILPKDNNNEDLILITNPGRKGGGGSVTKKGGKDLSSKSSPPPIAVARRNARERNRVKQVNNGFANLRQHIPNFIAQAFENSNGRGNKKLSKVETLRMAVEYIRSLEEILAMDGYVLPVAKDRSSRSESDSNCGQYSILMASPTDQDDEDDDDFSSVTTSSSPQQYIKINGPANTYEILPAELYGENAENLDPMSMQQQQQPQQQLHNHHHHQLLMVDHNSHQQLHLDSGLDLTSQDLSYLQINTAGSLSPGMYSENSSLSPGNEQQQQVVLLKSGASDGHQQCFIPVFGGVGGKLGENFNVHIKTEENELPVITLKTDGDGQIEAVNWWGEEEAQTDS